MRLVDDSDSEIEAHFLFDDGNGDGAYQRVPVSEAVGLESSAVRPHRVLILEDEPMIALDLVDIVESLGHSVIAVAQTAPAALSAAQKEHPELIISDIELIDGSNGYEIVKTILKTRPVPAIFVSGHLDILPDKGLPLPLTTIGKPYSEASVRQAITQAAAFDLSACFNDSSDQQDFEVALDELASLLKG